MRIAIVTLGLLVAAGLVSASGSARTASTAMASVNGRTVAVGGVHPTVATFLHAAGLRPPPGVRYAVVSHRVITDRDPGVAPAVFVDGRPAVPSTPVQAGQRILVRKGSAVEPTVTRSVHLAADERATPSPGLPEVERSLWHPGLPSHQAQLVGALSGEVVMTGPVVPATAAQPETDKVVALSFDDGPNPTWTPQVLRILTTERVRATFCDVGRWVWAHLDLVRAELAAGETLCDHTVDHDTTLDHATHEQVAFEVDRGADLISGVAGVRPQFYRPPGGILSPDVIATAHAQGMRVLTWSVDPSDYLVPPPDVLLGRILS
jgi:hypothetical protein